MRVKNVLLAITAVLTITSASAFAAPTVDISIGRKPLVFVQAGPSGVLEVERVLYEHTGSPGWQDPIFFIMDAAGDYTKTPFTGYEVKPQEAGPSFDIIVYFGNKGASDRRLLMKTAFDSSAFGKGSVLKSDGKPIIASEFAITISESIVASPSCVAIPSGFISAGSKFEEVDASGKLLSLCLSRASAVNNGFSKAHSDYAPTVVTRVVAGRKEHATVTYNLIDGPNGKVLHVESCVDQPNITPVAGFGSVSKGTGSSEWATSEKMGVNAAAVAGKSSSFLKETD